MRRATSSPRGRGAAAALLPLVLSLAACGASEDAGGGSPAATTTVARRAAPAPPAVCGALRATPAGRVQATAATELSGLVLSHRRAGVLWTHNDSGDGPRIFALSTRGALLGTVAVTGAQAVDWEDLAIGPRGDLFLGDIGDNDAVRPAVDVYRVPEPAAGATATAPARRYRLRYPDGPHDAETLLVDARSGDLVLVTKALSGSSGLYLARRPSSRSVTTLRRIGALELGLGGLATAGDVSADGRTVVVRTYTGIVAWSKRHDEALRTALRRRPCSGDVDLAGEGQGEALALTAGGGAFYTVPEGPLAIIRRYTAAG